MNRIVTSLAVFCACSAQPARAAEGFVFGTPSRLGPEVNTSSSNEWGPALSDDKLTLYYWRDSTGDIYLATRETIDSPFGNEMRLDEPINTRSQDGWPSLSSDDQTLHFGSSRREGFGNRDIWVSNWNEQAASWGEPENLGAPINSRSDEYNPELSGDRLSLYFQSNRRGGMGDVDIWVSHRSAVDQPWGEPENLGPNVNSTSFQAAPSVTDDGLMLFYFSDWNQYVSTRERIEDPWGPGVNLGLPVNNGSNLAGPEISNDGSVLFFPRGGGGSFDLWEVPLLPLKTLSLDPDSGPYSQDFDEALGTDSGRGTELPTGWSTSGNGIIFQDETTKTFPVRSSLGRTPTLNAGGENEADRALAIGVNEPSEERFLQLLTEVSDADATGLQLKFDIEAWDVKRTRRDEPGEAAFDVTVDVNHGDGFTQLLDLGTITTGAVLSPPEGDYLNGNAEANRVMFDSGSKAVDVSAGAQVRIRWKVPTDAQAAGWVYGLDNVEFSLLAGVLTGDFNGNGILDAGDLDTLTGQIAANSNDLQFDLDANGRINFDDRRVWVSDIKNTWFGDSNLDGEFNSGDLVAVFQAGEYEDNELLNSTWSTGDWNGDGDFTSGDLVVAFQDGGYEQGPRAASNVVPEPTSVILFMTCLIGIATRRRRSSCAS